MIYETFNIELKNQYHKLQNLMIGENILTDQDSKRYKLLCTYFSLNHRASRLKNSEFKNLVEERIEGGIKRKESFEMIANLLKDPSLSNPLRKLEKILD